MLNLSKNSMTNKIPEVVNLAAYPLSKLFPEKWKSWIFDALSDDAPFSWGDNDHTLVTIARFRSWLEEVMDWVDFEQHNDELTLEVYEKLKQLEQQEAFIDLDN